MSQRKHMLKKHTLLEKGFSQRDKVSSRIKQTLGKCIQSLRDPKLGMVSIRALMLSNDMRHAKVYISVVGCTNETEAAPSLAVLTRARGFLQQRLKDNCRLRVIPHLTFLFDQTTQGAIRIDELLRASRARTMSS